MDSDHVLVLFLALVLVGAAVALAYTSPLVFGDEEEVTDATLASFETTEPYCGDRDTIRGSSMTYDRTNGETLVINQTVPVPSNDTAVNASLDEFGPQRFILKVERKTGENQTESHTPAPGDDAENDGQVSLFDGDATTGTGESNDEDSVCHPEVRYNATINIDQPGEYTVLVTYDDELVNVHWRDDGDSGTYSKLPDPPAETAENNETTPTENARLPVPARGGV